MRYLMANEVLNLFTQRSVYDLMWGYEDELLNKVKNTNYYIGGDPTLETKFSFLKNMTVKPERDNIWTFYTGEKNSSSTRMIKNAYGFDRSKIV